MFFGCFMDVIKKGLLKIYRRDPYGTQYGTLKNFKKGPTPYIWDPKLKKIRGGGCFEKKVCSLYFGYRYPISNQGLLNPGFGMIFAWGVHYGTDSPPPL